MMQFLKAVKNVDFTPKIVITTNWFIKHYLLRVQKFYGAPYGARNKKQGFVYKHNVPIEQKTKEMYPHGSPERRGH